MTTPAYVAHQMKGRARLRVPSKEGDQAYFQEVERALAACPGVEWARASSITGSLLIYHRGALGCAISAVTSAGLFELAKPEEGGAADAGDLHNPTLDAICDHVACLDGRVGKETRGVGLRTMMFYGLVGATIYQTLRGQILPPSGTLLAYAAGLIWRTFDGRGAAPKKSYPNP